jgi:hypothetical protein
MDQLLKPRPVREGTTPLHEFARDSRGRIVSSEPRVNPNDMAIELFREMSASVRRIDDKLDLAREELAEVRGADLPKAIREHTETIREIHNRLGALEESKRTATAVGRPWWWFARELVKPILAALVAAVVTLAAAKGVKP